MKPPKPPKNLTGKTIVTPDGKKVRPNNRNPFKKSTLEEQEQRIDFCLKLLIRGFSKAEIHKAMSEKYNIHWRTIDDIYIVRAEKLRRERAAISSGDMRDTIITTLLDCLKTEKGNVRINASDKLALIFGCYAPRQTHVTTPVGQPFQMEDLTDNPTLPKERLREIVNALQPQAQSDGSNDEPSANVQ